MAGAKGVSAIADAPMSVFAIGITFLCCIINIADGLDFATMVQAAPLVTKAWHIKPQILGAIFAATAIGMAVGAFFIAPLADRYGRRPILLSALSLITLALFGTAISGSVREMMALRFFTGIGVGSLMANLNVMIIEYSGRKWGNFFLALMHLGFSLGVTLASQIGFWLAVEHGWRVIFVAGGLLNLVIVLAALVWLPESMQFLAIVQPPRALERINRIRRRIDLPPFDVLPVVERGAGAKVRSGDLFVPGVIGASALLWIASLCYSLIGYYHLSWTPKVLADAGLPTRTALLAGTLTSISSIFGNLTMGFYSSRLGAARLTALYFTGSAAAFLAFGLASGNPYAMLWITPVISFFTQGAFSGVMINATRFYPPAIRSSGVGFVVGFGRFGAIAGPLMGGVALGAGGALFVLYAGLAATAAIAGFCIFLVGRSHVPDQV